MNSISKLAFFILTLAIGYAFVYPSIGEIKTLMGEKQKYEKSLEMVSNVEIKKAELLKKFNNISEADKKDMETVLPSSLNLVKLISQIDVIASNYNISIDKISSKEVGSSVGTSIANAQPQKSYQSAIIGFSFDATYDKFNAFLDNLEKSLRILDIKSMKLETKENGVYTYTVEFEVYWLKTS